jgi:hypothetical protein
MGTKKFCGGSVKGLEDFYDNKTDTELTANLGELFEASPGAAKSKRDPKLFYFSVKTRVGALPLNGPIRQLRLIADYLEAMPEPKRVMFKIEVYEDKREGKKEQPKC